MIEHDPKAFSNAIALIRLVRQRFPNLTVAEAADIVLNELPETAEEKSLKKSSFKKRKK
jgi:hypothetical protein